MNSSTKKCHIIPPDELCCVWMSAGILSYQLCDRRLDCDQCPLDAAMRQVNARRGAAREAGDSRQSGPGNFREDRFYTRNHCWVKEIHSNVARIGIEPGLAGALVSPKAVVFPAENQRLVRGQTCLWIVLEGGTLPITSPLSGIVRGINPQLAEMPNMLRIHPMDHGWLFDLQVQESIKDPDLMMLEQVDPEYSENQAAFESLLARAVESGNRQVGVTLADGGLQLQSVADMLGPAKYFSLLRKIYG